MSARNSRKWSFTILACWIASVSLARAQPPNSCFPTDVNPCCWATYTTATVTSGPAYITAPGVTTSWDTPEVICNNCPQPRCCMCDPPLVRECSAGVGITLEISATATLNGELTLSAKELVEASLGASLGVTIGTSITFSVDCPIPTPGCAIRGGKVRITRVSGKTAAVDHSWSISGIWVSLSGWGCGAGSCPIQGGAWNATCPTTSSTATAKIESFECLALVSYPCVMICEH